MTYFCVYLDASLSLHTQVTKTRNDQLPHPAAFPCGFPRSAGGVTIFPGRPCLMYQLRGESFLCGSRHLLCLQMLLLCFSGLRLSSSAPTNSQTCQGPVGIPKSLSWWCGVKTVPVITRRCYLLFSLSLTSVQRSFPEPTCDTCDTAAD